MNCKFKSNLTRDTVSTLTISTQNCMNLVPALKGMEGICQFVWGSAHSPSKQAKSDSWRDLVTFCPSCENTTQHLETVSDVWKCQLFLTEVDNMMCQLDIDFIQDYSTWKYYTQHSCCWHVSHCYFGVLKQFAMVWNIVLHLLAHFCWNILWIDLLSTGPWSLMFEMQCFVTAPMEDPWSAAGNSDLILISPLQCPIFSNISYS